jgi:hypothetical protein
MRKAFICVLVAIALPLLASDLVITSVSVDPTPSLPGEPIWFTLSIKNNGSKALPVPKHGYLEAIPEGGEPVVLRSWDVVVSPLQDYSDFDLVIPAHETLRLDFTNGAIADGFLFQEPKLWKPGRHVLRVVLFENVSDSAIPLLGSVAWDQLLATGRLNAAPILSPDAIFAVREPSGVDGEAWAEFMRKSNNHGFNQGTAAERAELAYDIASRFPASAYSPYFAASAVYKFRGNRNERQRFLNEIISRHSDSPASEYLRGRAPFAKAITAKDAPDLDTALRIIDEARLEIERLLKKTPRTLTRLQIEKESKTLPSRETVASAFESQRH